MSNPPASAFQVPGLQMCTPVLGSQQCNERWTNTCLSLSKSSKVEPSKPVFQLPLSVGPYLYVFIAGVLGIVSLRDEREVGSKDDLTILATFLTSAF